MSTTTTDTTATGTDTTQDAATDTTTDTATQTGTGTEDATQDAAQDTDTGGESTEARMARLEKELTETRREAANYRVKGKTAAEEATAELRDQLAKALGLAPDDSDQAPTVESLTAQVQEATGAREQAEADARAARVELAVYRHADTANADPQALLDSRTFTDSLTDVDPTDSEAITAAIKAAVSNNPRLAKTQVVGASSVDHAGGSGEDAITPEQFRNMSGAERNDLYRRDPTTYARLTGRA